MRSGVRYAIGSRVRVQVSRVDLDSRRIDLRIVREGAEVAPVVRGRKGVSAAPAGPASAALSEVKARDREVKKARAKVAVARSAGVKKARQAKAARQGRR